MAWSNVRPVRFQRANRPWSRNEDEEEEDAEGEESGDLAASGSLESPRATADDAWCRGAVDKILKY